MHDGGPGRVRLAPIADFSAASLHFIKANVEAGATAKTDGWSGYSGAPGIDHDPHVVGSITAHIILPWTHRVFANLKTWAFGVYHGLREKPRKGNIYYESESLHGRPSRAGSGVDGGSLCRGTNRAEAIAGARTGP